MPRTKGAVGKDREWLHDLLDSVGDEKVVVKNDKGKKAATITRYQAMLRAGFEAATGVFVEKETTNGKKMIFQVEPKEGAFRTIFEQRFGRPPQTMDVTSGGKTLEPPVFKIPAFTKDV
jgi:hypothetical protein